MTEATKARQIVQVKNFEEHVITNGVNNCALNDSEDNTTGVRGEMTSFWEEHSVVASEEEMMLDSHAHELGQREIPEILSLLPDFSGKTMLELGAGIGRFTEHFCKKASHVTSVDFMQSFVEKNKERNGHHSNTTIYQADVTKMKLASLSLDLVFSNWLMMYLSDEETEQLVRKILDSLVEGGYFFFRESCFHQSGDISRKKNPTVYREPAWYNALIQAVTVPTTDNQEHYGLEVVLSRSVRTYLEMKQNGNQICWLLQKVKRQGTQGYQTFQEFLDKQQYSTNGILRYERIFGKHFVSTGGRDTTQEFLRMLDLKKGQHVLDVGVGIGGSAFLMAQEYGVSVTGIDLSSNMISIGLQRATELDIKNVTFEIADATKRNFPSEYFDVVYSRDTILHIKDKPALFASFLKWLKPGGKLLISDYCCSDGEHSDDFKAYVAQRGYHLHTVPDYGKILEDVGFINVKAEDRTWQFVESLNKELARLRDMKDDFIKEFSRADYEALETGWSDKQKRCDRTTGNQRWGLFYAEKAAS